MRIAVLLPLVFGWVLFPAQAQTPIAPGGTLRAVFLGGNPAQATRDAKTGEVAGPAAVLARALGAELGIPVALQPVSDIKDVVDAVAESNADIGFLAYEPSRAGKVDFSQIYELVQQTFIVGRDSSIGRIADVDRPGLKLAGTTNDSITLYMRRTIKNATVVAVENDQELNKRRLLAGEFDAFSGNRHRMTAWALELPGTRVLPDNLFDVPQAIVVAKGKMDALLAINAFLDRARASGMIENSIAASRLVGVVVAPTGYRPQIGE